MRDRYHGLRCRPGDLAVIIQDEPECQANIGQIVRVLKESLEFPDELGFHWDIQPLSSQPSPVVISNYRDKTLSRKVIHDLGPRAHLDAWLQPLLEDEAPEESNVQAETLSAEMELIESV